MTDELDAFLRSMEYPCRPGDLGREARRDGVSPAVVDALSQLPERSYSSRWDILNRTSILASLPVAV